MVTRSNDVVVVDPTTRLVRVCAWCVPPVRLAELSRTYRCTHSLCPDCQQLLLQETA